MSIDMNREAMQTMSNALGSLENKFREVYNKGYRDGLRDGANQVTAKIVSKILEEADDRKTKNCSEIPTSSEPQTCSFSDCDNFKNPDYARCIECERKQIESNHR